MYIIIETRKSKMLLRVVEKSKQTISVSLLEAESREKLFKVGVNIGFFQDLKTLIYTSYKDYIDICVKNYEKCGVYSSFSIYPNNEGVRSVFRSDKITIFDRLEEAKLFYETV